MNLVFKDQTFSFELLRTLSYAPYGGADIGECLSTAYRIEEGNFESWYTEWYKTAERIHALAIDSLERGNRISAREFYMRASNYYRTAEFFLHGNPTDPRILETWGNSRNTFRQAIRGRALFAGSHGGAAARIQLHYFRRPWTRRSYSGATTSVS
ncbi:hypothetical protein [Paenibacillus alba]|uniref:Uncharacterized protein n=1 Tax=Paenibacillus alba TaxID=1197127 RepID=A0ABU6FVA9_9BACL|nr:hypothetical protein [Paenibacillus alba]MEC0225661.1 hypothetical protein [Paenibacillus alba]